jgi:putative transposase
VRKLKEVYRSEITVIRKGHRLYKYCDETCLKAKNVYNRTNFLARDFWDKNHKIIFSFEMMKIMRTEECFKSLPAQTSQQVILKLGNNWKSYFIAIKDWSKHKSKYTGKPNLPNYKDKNGRFVAEFNYQQGKFKDGKYWFPKMLDFEFKNYIETNIEKKDFVLLQIIPCGNCYKISIIYKESLEEKESYNERYLSIDLGINNLATLTNNIGLRPIVINGRILKSINVYYNKLFSQASSYIGRGTSNRIQRITTKRNNIVSGHFHKISRYIINYCLENNIDNIIIGRNKDWKRNVNIGKKNNQIFVQIPFEMLINNLIYKGEEVGIGVKVISEEYTSKASFLDNDEFTKGFEFSGKRIRRGMYKSKDGILINADVNGSYNILRKCNPEMLWQDEIKGVSLHPVRVNI